jgi:Thioredoxin reductase
VYASDNEDIRLKGNAKVVKGEKPVAVSREGKKIRLDTDKESYEADGLFILRQSVSPGQLVPGLVTEGPHIKVDREMKTSIKGLFACGDIAGRPYQYIKSAGEGNVAALSAVSYLAERQKDGK